MEGQHPFLKDVFNVSSLHKDNDLKSCAWMLVLEGKKRFYLIPPEAEEKVQHWLDVGPIFTSKERVAEGRALGMLVADLEEGDLLCFPSFWLHEVHNLTSDSRVLTNAVPWPKKES